MELQGNRNNRKLRMYFLCLSVLCPMSGIMKSQKLVHYWGGIAENPKSFSMGDCGQLLCLSGSNVNFSIYSHQQAIAPPYHPLKVGYRQSNIVTYVTRPHFGTFIICIYIIVSVCVCVFIKISQTLHLSALDQ